MTVVGVSDFVIVSSGRATATIVSVAVSVLTIPPPVTVTVFTILSPTSSGAVEFTVVT